jgi:tetratricopeptide (TPR) repeat protein
MMRDLIYESMLRRQRTAAHRAFADWLARGRRAEEHLPLIAEHYEKAGQHDAAAEYEARAGDRAMAVCAFAEARSFYQRALELAAVPPATGPSTPTPPLTEALQPAVGTSSRPEAALRLALGEVLRLLGSYGDSRDQLELALDLARDQRSRAAAYYQLSQVASAQGDYPEAQRLLDLSLPEAELAGDPATLAQVLYGLGDLLWRGEDYDKAVPILEASLEQARRASHPSSVLYALNRLGSVRLFQKRVDEARALYEEGRQLAMETGNRDRLVAFLNNLGEVERLEGDAAAARDLYRETVRINREIGRPDVEAVLLSNLSAVSLQLGELDEAERYAREGLAVARDIGLTRMMVGGLILFAQLAAASGDTDRALALLGLVQVHPATDADLRKYAAPTLEELGGTLSGETIENGLARGRDLSFDGTVAELLAAAGPDSTQT